jgi:threonine aldolase
MRQAGMLGAADLVTRLKARGVLAGAFGPDAIRLVTHRDVSREDCIDAGMKTASIS